MTFKLTLHPIAHSRSGTEYGTDPVMLYDIEGLPEGKKISVRNVRPAAQEPVWQIGAHIRGRPTESRARTASMSLLLSINQEKPEGVPVPFGAVIERYLAQELPERNSTASRYRSQELRKAKMGRVLVRPDQTACGRRLVKEAHPCAEE